MIGLHRLLVRIILFMKYYATDGFFWDDAAVSTTPPGTPPRTTGQSQPITPRTRAVEAPTTTPLKRRYVADSHDVEVVKKIKQNEIELRDRNTVLRGTKANVS